jgi:hypothetical protein
MQKKKKKMKAYRQFPRYACGSESRMFQNCVCVCHYIYIYIYTYSVCVYVYVKIYIYTCVCMCVSLLVVKGMGTWPQNSPVQLRSAGGPGILLRIQEWYNCTRKRYVVTVCDTC